MITKPKASIRVAKRSRSLLGLAGKRKGLSYRSVASLIRKNDVNGLISAVEMGVSVGVAHALPGAFDIAQSKIAILLGVSPKTMQRWHLMTHQRLTRPVGERAIRLLQLRQQAIETFEDEKHAVAWLSEENKAFDGRRPIEHAHTELGCQQVECLLTRIDQGIFS